MTAVTRLVSVYSRPRAYNVNVMDKRRCALALSVVFLFLCVTSFFMIERSVRETIPTKPEQFRSTEFVQGTLTPLPAPSIPLRGCPFTRFRATVFIGLEQSFQLVVDTGSSTLAVGGDECDTCGGVSPLWHTSDTATDLHLSVSQSYADGSSWRGSVWNDLVALGDVEGNNLTQRVNMNIGVITRQSMSGYDSAGNPTAGSTPFFDSTECVKLSSAADDSSKILSQGMIGLAYPVLAQANTDSFIFNLFNHTGTPAIFSLQQCQSAGTLWIGGWDGSRAKEPVVWTPIVDESSYSISPSDVLLNDRSLGFTEASFTMSNNRRSIVDSGTGVLMLPINVYRAIVGAIIADPSFKRFFRSTPDNNFFDQSSGQCEAPKTDEGGTASWEELQRLLPTFTILMTNGLLLRMDGVGSYLLPCTASSDSLSFTSGIVGSPNGGMVGGWALMNQFLVIHDIANRQLGFAASVGCSNGANGRETLHAHAYMFNHGSSGTHSRCTPFCFLVWMYMVCLSVYLNV